MLVLVGLVALIVPMSRLIDTFNFLCFQMYIRTLHAQDENTFHVKFSFAAVKQQISLWTQQQQQHKQQKFTIVPNYIYK